MKLSHVDGAGLVRIVVHEHLPDVRLRLDRQLQCADSPPVSQPDERVPWALYCDSDEQWQRTIERMIVIESRSLRWYSSI